MLLRSLIHLLVLSSTILILTPGTSAYTPYSMHYQSRSRILSGTKAVPGEFPWMVNLRRRKHLTFFCGAALITDRYLVSAAHCISQKASWDIVAVIGDHSIRRNDKNEQRIPVLRTFIHQRYYSRTFANDIALLKLRSTVKMGIIQPLALPYPQTNVRKYLSGKVLVTGWGTLASGGKLPDVLQKITLPVVNIRKCEKSYGRKKPYMFCAGAPGEDACQGDSGGPAVIMSGRIPRLAGIVSHGIGCGRREYPGVYTDVSYFTTWILDTITGAEQEEQDSRYPTRNDKYLTEDEYIAQLEKDFKENTDFKDETSKDQDETKISSYAADLERIFSGLNDHQDGFDEESNSLWDSGEYNWKEEKTYPSYKP